MIWPFSTIKALRAEVASAREDAASWERIATLRGLTSQELNAAKMELARQLAEACRERDEAAAQCAQWQEAEKRKRVLLSRIAYLGCMSKNGTARKLGRMAGEALE